VRVEESVWRESGCGEEVCVEREVRGRSGVDEVVHYYIWLGLRRWYITIYGWG
jgi:hypothetical protein